MDKDTFLFSLIKKYVSRYSNQPDAKTIFKMKNKLVTLAMELYEREKCSYDDALDKALDELEKENEIKY
jgi:hypothetical protein